MNPTLINPLALSSKPRKARRCPKCEAMAPPQDDFGHCWKCVADMQNAGTLLPAKPRRKPADPATDGPAVYAKQIHSVHPH